MLERVDTGKKGVYIDGHERPDVVQERELFLQKIQDYETSHLPPPCPSDCLHVDCPSTRDHTLKQLVIICHDKSAFQSNEDQTFSWLQHDQIVIKPKSRRSGRMVSDFVDEHSGFLRLTEEEFEIAREHFEGITKEAREIIEYGENRDGFWTGEKFLSQVKKALLIAEFKYPREKYTLLWLFDQSSNHRAKAQDALVAHKMNVRPGGDQPRIRDTIYQGKLQKMVFDDGTPKGVRVVLEERGIDTSRMLKQDTIAELGSHQDFASELSTVEHAHYSRKGSPLSFFSKVSL